MLLVAYLMCSVYSYWWLKDVVTPYRISAHHSKKGLLIKQTF